MASISGILSTGAQGLFASQAALQITSQNIANVNTVGYSRQRPTMESSPHGNGVRVTSIERLRDRYLDARLREALTEQGSLAKRSEILSRLETFLDETNAMGPTQLLSDLFSSLHDLTLNPSGASEREMLRAKANSLAQALNANSQRMDDMLADVEFQIRETVNQINDYAQQIAKLNAQATYNHTTGRVSNELVDQRDLLIEKMASLVQVQKIDNPDGSVAVLVAGGMAIVDGITANELAVRRGDNALADLEVEFVAGKSMRLAVGNGLDRGQLGELLSMYRGRLSDIRDSMDRFAATLMQRFNLAHQAGAGLDGVSGRDFFDGLEAYAAPAGPLTGGAVVTATGIASLSGMTMDQFEIRFTSATTFDVVNASTGVVVSSGNAYNSGVPIAVSGMSITITDMGGGPKAGDTFRVNGFRGAAARIEVAAAIQNSIQAIAAGLTSAAGDNRNALALAQLETMDIAPGGASTLSEYYTTILSNLGIAVNQSQINENRQDMIVEQLKNFVQENSGVSVDEESVNLIQYQRAFEASSRVISVANDMLDAILRLVG
ncbi:MAG: Flagellar hook-associated protein 1 [candidate division BRC1 bacterium ADurb.BinA364]|nr:MAG: Flagellar hook-associated protein 1 [candidate division BRC1 bacterium ADurb.BinA364]